MGLAVVRDGLLDRSEDVRAACATMICEHWLPAESDATRFLMRFNVRDKENEVRRARKWSIGLAGGLLPADHCVRR
jgi:hypothetical protein